MDDGLSPACRLKKREKPMQKRRRVKQTTSLQERIVGFSENVRKQAEAAVGQEKEELLKKLRCADAAVMLNRQLCERLE